jgi:hypothetical protein
VTKALAKRLKHASLGYEVVVVSDLSPSQLADIASLTLLDQQVLLGAASCVPEPPPLPHAFAAPPSVG